MSTIDLRREIEDFYYREAWLLDNDKLEEWLDLLSEDIRYWAPIRQNVPRAREDFEVPFLSAHFDENKAGLKFRVARSRSGAAYAEEGARVRRFVSNVMILNSEADTVKTSANFQLFRSRENEQWYVGTRLDELRRSPPGWVIQNRMIVFDHGVINSIITYV